MSRVLTFAQEIPVRRIFANTSEGPRQFRFCGRHVSGFKCKTYALREVQGRK